MADNLSSGIVRGQRLEGFFGYIEGGRIPLGERKLDDFFLRYPNGDVYAMDEGCRKPRADRKNGDQKLSDMQILQDAVDLMRNSAFALQESSRLSKTPEVKPITPQEISDFAKKLEAGCMSSLPPKPARSKLAAMKL